MSPHLGWMFFVFLKGDKVMDKDVRITPEQLAKAMDADYQKLAQMVSGPGHGWQDRPRLSSDVVHLSRCNRGVKEPPDIGACGSVLATAYAPDRMPLWRPPQISAL